MTPAARLQAAAGILDRVLAGAAAEQALTSWARASRFAGSGDRAAVRDHVFDALRRLRSLAARTGQDRVSDRVSGRALALGLVIEAGGDPYSVFTGAGHAPAPLDAGERAALAAAAPARDWAGGVRLDVPDWLLEPFAEALGAGRDAALLAMRERAGVFLRVNAARAGQAEVIAALADDGIVAEADPRSPSALRIASGAERVRRAAAYLDGRAELQDASVQAACAMVPLPRGGRVLDLCAGGGGKTLALAASAAFSGSSTRFFVHDVKIGRMADIAPRWARSGIGLPQPVTLGPDRLAGAGTFDLVVADVPCSGSGTWARTPDAKWRLTPERLAELVRTQAGILDTAAAHVAPGGRLAYMTCALLAAENAGQIVAFRARHPDFVPEAERLFLPGGGAGGFYLALLTRGAGGG